VGQVDEQAQQRCRDQDRQGCEAAHAEIARSAQLATLVDLADLARITWVGRRLV
jgi:hypothetical protein